MFRTSLLSPPPAARPGTEDCLVVVVDAEVVLIIVVVAVNKDIVCTMKYLCAALRPFVYGLLRRGTG